MNKKINERTWFYQKTVDELIKNRDATILICGGGTLDKNVFEQLGFHNVTISNLMMQGDDYSPFVWKYEDAESLTFPSDSFDYVVVHAVIHHASSPHKVLTEMYRVAKIGILAFESRDSSILQFLARNEFIQTYEHAAVYYKDCTYGGVNNTEIPNYIYRWTEREIEKTIQSYAPCCKHNFEYRYGTAFPYTPGLEFRDRFKYFLLRSLRPVYELFVRVFPRQQNLFAFFVEKPVIPDDIFPWLTFDDATATIHFNKKWGEQRYNPNPEK